MATFTNFAISPQALAGFVNLPVAQPRSVFDPRLPIQFERPPLVAFPGFRFPGTPTPQPTTPTPQPPSPTASASDLQVLMSQIPAADDGDVIRSEHFNLMRAALFELAGRLGVGPVQTSMVTSVVPAFRKQAQNAEWVSEYGIAKASTAGDVKGWMEVELPDGARLQEMKVFAKRTGAGTGPFNVVLKRQKITDPTDTVDLITVAITASTDAKVGETSVVKVAVSDPSALEEYRKVDNRSYNYLVAAEVTLAAGATGAAGDTAQVNAIQIVCRNAAT